MSGIRLRVAQISIRAATVDVVTCDLSQDPRSESYIPKTSGTPRRSGRWAAHHGALAKCGDDLDPNVVAALKGLRQPGHVG